MPSYYAYLATDHVSKVRRRLGEWIFSPNNRWRHID